MATTAANGGRVLEARDVVQMKGTMTAVDEYTDRTNVTHEAFRHPAIKLEEALRGLREARNEVPRDDPRGRDLSLAITDVEDAIMRLRHGTP